MRPALWMCAAVLIAALSTQSFALEPRDGWEIRPTSHSFSTLVKRLRAAVKKAPIAIVTQASASDGARASGITIPGNRVFGLYRNDYARRMLEASVAAGIEAPIRMYVTENADGTATLSWKTPSAVFAPYLDEGGDPLAELSAELDTIFEAVALDATTE